MSQFRLVPLYYEKNDSDGEAKECRTKAETFITYQSHSSERNDKYQNNTKLLPSNVRRYVPSDIHADCNHQSVDMEKYYYGHCHRSNPPLPRRTKIQNE